MNRDQFEIQDIESGEIMTISYDQRRIWNLTQQRPEWAAGYRGAIRRDDNSECYICGELITDKYEIDHVHSWSDIRKIMMNDPELWILDDSEIIEASMMLYYHWNNLRATHAECNRNKGSESWPEGEKNDPDGFLYTQRAIESKQRQNRGVS